MSLDPETAAKYATLQSFPRRRSTKRTSKLDTFKPAITRWLERHPYSATQIYQRLCADESYTGGFRMVKAYVRAVRPARCPAFDLKYPRVHSPKRNEAGTLRISLQFSRAFPQALAVGELRPSLHLGSTQ